MSKSSAVVNCYNASFHLKKLVLDLMSWNVTLAALDQPIETNTSMGRMIVDILGAVAEFERELIRERTIDGIRKAEKEGRKGGRPRREVDIEPILEARREGASWREISNATGRR